MDRQSSTGQDLNELKHKGTPLDLFKFNFITGETKDKTK